MPEALPPPEESPLLRSLGIKPVFEDEANAPPIDVETLRRYYRAELDETAYREVERLVARFRSWYMALGEVVRDRAK